MLAEPADPTLLVEVWCGGTVAPWPGTPGAAGLPPAALGSGCPRRLAPQHRARSLPVLQVLVPVILVPLPVLGAVFVITLFKRMDIIFSVTLFFQ